MKNNNYVIGVDGGATKTAAALADMEGRIVGRAVAGPSNPRNIGIKEAAKNIAEAIQGVIKGKRSLKIKSVFVGMPALEEEFKSRKAEIIAEIKKQKKIAKILSGKVNVGSDQLVAFRAGAAGREGILVIAGTGMAVHGWNDGRELIVNSRGWLLSKGSGNWIGRHVARAIVEDFEGRGPKTRLGEYVFKKMKFKTIDDLARFIYENPTWNIPRLAEICDEAATNGDKAARDILIAAGKEISAAVRAVAAKLIFSEPVPLVQAGRVYRSRWVADTAMDDIERYYPHKFDFVVVGDPVAGAVRLALEAIKK
jgi:N-acetylglucosamine kinase-like BadF-type ATPase